MQTVGAVRQVVEADFSLPARPIGRAGTEARSRTNRCQTRERVARRLGTSFLGATEGLSSSIRSVRKPHYLMVDYGQAENATHRWLFG